MYVRDVSQTAAGVFVYRSVDRDRGHPGIGSDGQPRWVLQRSHSREERTMQGTIRYAIAEIDPGTLCGIEEIDPGTLH